MSLVTGRRDLWFVEDSSVRDEILASIEMNEGHGSDLQKANEILQNRIINELDPIESPADIDIAITRLKHQIT